MEREINAGDTATIVCAVFQGLATLFVGARLFCRIKLLDKLYFDDWVILISLVRSRAFFPLLAQDLTEFCWSLPT